MMGRQACAMIKVAQLLLVISSLFAAGASGLEGVESSTMELATQNSSIFSPLANMTPTVTDTIVFDEFAEQKGGVKPIVSKELHDMFEQIIDLYISSILSCVGVVANIIAIMVFIKMGFQNTINISLASITFWDLIKCLCNIVVRLYGPIQHADPILAISWKIVTLTIFGYLNIIIGYVSGVLAAYVAVERCLCVSLPFTVKFLLTRCVVISANIIIPLVVFGFHVIVYAIITFQFVYSPAYNTTIAQHGFTSLHYKYPAIDVYTSIMSLVSPTFSFTVMIVCTILISYHLKQSSRVRSQTLKDGVKTEKLSNRDKQVIKMLLIIIIVYIVTYIPKFPAYFGFLVIPEYRPQGAYGNLVWINLYIMFFSDLVNATVNPFIYYTMSTAFKEAFTAMYCANIDKKLADK